MTRDSIHIKRKLNRLRKQIKKNSSQKRITEVAMLSRELKKKMKQERFNFYNVRLSTLVKEAPAKFWRTITPKTSSTNTYNVGNDFTSDAAKISDAFNTHFETVFSKDDGSIPLFDNFQTLPPIEDMEITESGIFNLLLNLDLKKSD